jgi:diguanylate cyclase (GGDEF)-like protein
MPPRTTTPRILLATAHRDLALRLTAILTRLPYAVQTAEDGSEALKVLLGIDPPEIALLDSALPVQSGLKLAAELRRRAQRKQTWIMLLSSAADPATITAASNAGIDDLLLCPAADDDQSIDQSIPDDVREADLRIRLSVASRVQQLGHQLQAQIQAAGFHATRDHLTGLWNRESLLSLLFPETDRVQRMGTPLGFLLLDLDNFAAINAEYGQEAGDTLLMELASRIRRYMRSYDLIGRCGDDEFLVALPGCNTAQSLQLASRIRTVVLRPPFSAGRDMVTLTASIGLAQSRGRSPLVVLREAERALADAKREGRNCEHEYLTPQQQACDLKLA